MVRDSVDKQPSIVADHDKRGAAGVKRPLQPFDGGQIEMVGRLVEEENIRRRGQDPRQRRAPRLAAGQLAGLFAASQPELFQHRARGVVAVARPQSGFDIRERRGEAGEIRLLGQIAHQRSRLYENRAAVGLDQAGRHLQQRRFAGAVAPDQADPLAGADRQFGVGQKRRPAEGERDVFKLEKRSHSLDCRRSENWGDPRRGRLIYCRSAGN